MTTQERLGNALNKALDDGFIDDFDYIVLDRSTQSIIGGCVQTAILRGLGHTDAEINAASSSGYGALVEAPKVLMENIDTLHCCGKVTARAIAELLLKNKIPELEVDVKVLEKLAKDLPTRDNEISAWDE